MERKCGVLLHVSSLPSDYGIGSISKEAFAFVDFLQKAGQSYWQVLPLGQTGYGDSPYQSCSTFAGNPYFIDIDELIRAGYIEKEDAAALNFGEDPGKVDYEAIFNGRYPLLKKAFKNSPFAQQLHGKWADPAYDKARTMFTSYILENADWLPDYALYQAVKDAHGGAAFTEWEEDIRLHRPEAVMEWSEKLSGEVRFYEFLQYIFSLQWSRLKKYANEKGIRFIGDIPIYVAYDSADTWSHPELFELDEKGFPTMVAGVPPDAFSETGQLWGNPLYDWDKHRETGYAWWIRRIEMCFDKVDMIRIDHFRGFDEYYAIPYGAPSAMNGTWKKGPGMELFSAIREKLENDNIIAEDLGYITPTVRKLLEDTGYPGMKVLQFAFSPGADSEYLPHKYEKNCVVYTGTHDNDTTRSWYDKVDEQERKFINKYLGIASPELAVAEIIRGAFISAASTAIVPMQDYLELGNEARMNFPSTLGGNWEWRMLPGDTSDALADRMYEMAKIYGRL